MAILFRALKLPDRTDVTHSSDHGADAHYPHATRIAIEQPAKPLV